MKGVINKGIQELVESRFGEKALNDVKTRAKCEEPFFVTSKNYPDESTMALIGRQHQSGGDDKTGDH